MSSLDARQTRGSAEALQNVAEGEGPSTRTVLQSLGYGIHKTSRIVLIRSKSSVASVARLLTTGYASETSQRRYERKGDWERMRATLLRKIEHIGVVSGLLLASSATLLVSSDLRRMTYTATIAAIYGSILSIIFGLLCLWILLGIRNESDMKVLLRHPLLFYYLFGSPSLFGGASALTFFVAVGAWCWLDQGGNAEAHGGRVSSITIGTILMLNAGVCFVLGTSKYHPQAVPDRFRYPSYVPEAGSTAGRQLPVE